MPANDGVAWAQMQLKLQLKVTTVQVTRLSADSPSHTHGVDQPGIDPSELESRAVEVAALAAGISQAQALRALDASATLIRRAMALRLMAALGNYGPTTTPAERRVMTNIIDQVLAAVDST